jgi:glycosyltransferase involved in cell wall biosynthesis
MKSRSTAPLVSIITPAFNSARYIAETVTSALAQTFTDFELIVADDGSTDDTIDVVLRTAAGDPRVLVVTPSHGGPATARNAAFAVSQGRFIALLDSDDVWMPEYLTAQLDIAGRCPGLGVVTANAINLGGDLDGRPLWPSTDGVRTISIADLIVEENAVCIMSVFRREALERVGGFDPRFNGNEDYEFWLRTANAGFGIVQHRRPLGYYRRRAGSVSSDDVRTISGMIRVLESASEWSGPIERELDVIGYKIAQLRDELTRARLRASLSRSDGDDAALQLKDLSELRGSVCLAIAAKVTKVWPQLLVRAYGWRRALRAS